MDVVIGLGSNLGKRRQTLISAIHGMRAFVDVTAVSALYETEAVGPPQPAYLNAALRGLYSGVDAFELLDRLLEIERKFGRERRERWAARTLDIDILWISRLEVSSATLVVPHPRLAERRFALEPLLDVAEDAVHPTSGERYRDVLRRLPQAEVVRVAGRGWADRDGR